MCVCICICVHLHIVLCVGVCTWVYVYVVLLCEYVYACAHLFQFKVLCMHAYEHQMSMSSVPPQLLCLSSHWSLLIRLNWVSSVLQESACLPLSRAGLTSIQLCVGFNTQAKPYLPDPSIHFKPLFCPFHFGWEATHVVIETL